MLVTINLVLDSCCRADSRGRHTVQCLWVHLSGLDDRRRLDTKEAVSGGPSTGDATSIFRSR